MRAFLLPVIIALIAVLTVETRIDESQFDRMFKSLQREGFELSHL